MSVRNAYNGCEIQAVVPSLLQVLVTAVVVGLLVHFLCGLSGPCAIVVGNGLALSSTAVVLQVR